MSIPAILHGGRSIKKLINNPTSPWWGGRAYVFSKEAVAISEKFQNCKNAEVMPEMIASPASEQQNLIFWG